MAVGTGPAELLDLATTAAQRAVDLLVDGLGRARATVETGQPANFVIFDRNPRDPTRPQEDVRVMKIIRDGETVFRAQD